MDQNMSLGPDDCFVVVRFIEPGSAQFTVHPNNMSAAQMLLVAELLKWQATTELNEERERRTRTVPKIVIPNA